MKIVSSQWIYSRPYRRESTLSWYVIKFYGLAMLLLSALLALGALILPARILYDSGIGLISLFQAVTTATGVFGFAVGAFKWGKAISQGKRSSVIGLCVVLVTAFALFGWITFASGLTSQGKNVVLIGSCVTFPLLLSCLINWRRLDGGSEIYADK